MIKDPKNGWCSFDLDTFHGTPSYLTDVVIDLLNAFIQYYTTGAGIAWFDEEGTEFTLVLTPYSIFIIEDKEKPVLYDFSLRLNIKNLEKELIEDIENNLIGWSEFIPDGDREEVIVHRNEIRTKLITLKNLMS